jgi:hypothetical protein
VGFRTTQADPDAARSDFRRGSGRWGRSFTGGSGRPTASRRYRPSLHPVEVPPEPGAREGERPPGTLSKIAQLSMGSLPSCPRREAFPRRPGSFVGSSLSPLAYRRRS